MPQEVELVWADRDSHGGLVPRRDRGPFRYRAFVPDQVADLDLPLSADAAAEIEDAASACAQLDASPGIDDLEPVARLLLRAESVASSRIEGLNLSHRRLEEASFEPKAARGMALSILRNIEAMDRAIQIGNRQSDLTVEDLLEIHRVLMYTKRDEAIAGMLRETQSWIGGGITPKRADFVPPPWEFVRELLDDLIRFCNRTDLSAVTQAAVAHAQFETIHPFADGNGRTGRCLIHVIFRRRGLSARVVPPVSVALAADAPAYVEGLTAFRRGETQEWVAQFGATTTLAGARAIDLGGEIREMRGEWHDRLGKLKRGSVGEKLLQGLVQHPMVSVESVSRLYGVSDEAARNALARFTDAGVLAQVTIGKRNRAWAAREVFQLLDEFDKEMRTRQ